MHSSDLITKKSLFSWILKRYVGLQVFLILLILSTIFFRVLPLELQKRIVNQAIAFKKVDILLIYCGLYIGAVMLAGILKYVINVLQSYIGQKILRELREKLYDHILSLPISFFRRTPPGMVIASLTSELSAIGDFLGGSIAIPLINVLTLVTFAGYLIYLNPLLAILSFAIYPIEIIIIPFLQRRFNRLNTERIDATRTMSNVIGEAISGIHEIHGNASYHLENKKLGLFNNLLFSLRNRMNNLKFLIKFVNNFFQSLGPFILFLLGGYLTIQGRLDLGALVAFLSAYEKLYDPWKELMDYYQDLQDSYVRYHRIMDYFDVQPEFALAPTEDREPYRLKGELDIRDLSFIVDGQIRLLDQVSLEVKPGEQLAVVGLSGSGKSTLAMVIGQLYSYTTGHVRIDGRELKTLSKLDVSKNIGYIAQYPFIFDGSIRKNLLYACESILQEGESSSLPGREEILRVLELVGLSDDILKIGLNTLLKPGEHQEFTQKIIRLRETFFKRWGEELATAVDFFDLNRFQRHIRVGDNITFGYPNRDEYKLEALPRNPLFLEFLSENELMKPLFHLGEEIARQTVSLLKDLPDDPFFFAMNPIPQEEFDYYTDIVDRMTKSGRNMLTRQDEDAVLRLALRFIPAQHKMASISFYLETSIVSARRRFMEKIAQEDPGAFNFYRPTDYVFSQNILDNILFGQPKADHPQAMERVREKVEELLKEQNLIDEIIEIGLDFQVGSKGDRLSGGQKQKIAIARGLLKNPQILILDEATASLDNASQARIQHLFSSELKGKCTLISVVHRLELVRGFDLIAVMKAGKIVEMGRFDDLMQRKGLFYELAHGT